MLFLGDIIYSDVPWYAGKSVERYFKHYRQLFSSPEIKAMAEKIRESRSTSYLLFASFLTAFGPCCSSDQHLGRPRDPQRS